MSDEDFAAGMGRLEELIARAEESCSPESLPVVRELVRSLLDVHRIGLAELLAAIEDGARASGADAARAAASRPAVAGLLLMHDLHPDALATRVEQALREANGASTGGATAELLRIDDLYVRVVVSGKRAAAQMLARVVERTLCERAPDATVHLDVAAAIDDDRQGGLVPLDRLRARSGGKT